MNSSVLGRVWVFGVQAPHSSFFFEKKIENHVLKFQIILQKNLNVARDVSYNCVTFQFKITYTLGCTKMMKMQI
jgi:hypothetical protein